NSIVRKRIEISTNENRGQLVVSSDKYSLVDNLFYNLHDYASQSKHNIIIDDGKVEKLLNLICNVLDRNVNELNDSVFLIIKDIEKECKYYVSNVLYRSVGSRKNRGREVEWSSYKYNKEFNKVLDKGIISINNEVLKFISKEREGYIERVESIAVTVKNKILELNNNIAEVLLSIKNKVIVLNKESVVAKVEEINYEVHNKFIKGNGNTNFSNRNLTEIKSILKELNKMEILDNRINKLSTKESDLLKVIKEILDSNLIIEDKQLAIEKTVVEYELTFFRHNMDTHETRNKIIHNIYPKLNKAYTELLANYKLNRYSKIKKSIHLISNKSEGTKSKEMIKLIVVLVILYIGIDKCISYSFYQIINLLTNARDGTSRTNIAINLGFRIIKVLKYIKLDENPSLNALYPINKLKDEISKLDNEGIYWIGDTLLGLITANCDIVVEELKWNSGKDSQLEVRINDKFISNLTVSGINIVQLPMLTEPRKISSDGLYFPYINSDTTNLHLFEGELIKGKYNLRDHTEASEMLYSSINYLNSIKFKINKAMLNFILAEWDNKDSKLFKGYNMLKPILETDSKEIKEEKVSSNSKYTLYSNIISLASLYKDNEFYLPVYVDFRGRVYPLSNYISYQGGDLARSLILFADTKCVLNNSGKECLNVYLANLAGYDKLPWSERLTKVDGIIKEYLESNEISNTKYIEDNIDKISEPFQFISIMYAKLLSISNPKANISNPILFDASCSGIQHIAALTLEKELASNVNLYTDSSNPKEDYPQDFYTYALEKIRDKLINSDITELRDIKLNRKIIKRSVMTIPYNISMAGIGEHLMEHFTVKTVLKYRYVVIPGSATISSKDVYLDYSKYGQLCKIIYFVLTKELPSLRLLSNYFESMIDIFVKLNIPITWVTPSGLKIKYTNIKFKPQKVKTSVLNTSKITTIKLPTDSLDVLSTKRSFMPNFIHSLDASNVHLLLNSVSYKNLPVYTVHDCFASTANNMFKLEKLVKNAFINIYFNDEGYLLKLHKHFVDTIISATDPYLSNGNIENENDIKGLTTERLEYKPLLSSNYVADRISTKADIIKIPDLPAGYKNKNKNINEFVKGILNSKYFIG
uniref:Probable DNA-directed RNA polymerase n=1 Tax=Agaricus bitorquis TaxID=5343 RepID=RPOP_AGABT